MRSRVLFFLVLLVFAIPALAGDGRSDFDSRLDRVLSALTREASIDQDGESTLTTLIQREYGARDTELSWARGQSFSWGEIVALAYLQATNGRAFSDLSDEGAHRDLYGYAERAGMSHDKMARSLETFLRRAERERNSRIFERLRVSRRVHPLPDLGSGFGLFQETLDFRRIDLPRPTKIHSDPIGRGKWEK